MERYFHSFSYIKAQNVITNRRDNIITGMIFDRTSEKIFLESFETRGWYYMKKISGSRIQVKKQKKKNLPRQKLVL